MQQHGLIVFLFFRSRTISRSRSLRYGFFLTGGIQNTPACTVSESTETPGFSELTADIKPRHILSVHSSHQPRPDADWKAQKVCGCFLKKDMKESEARLLRNVLSENGNVCRWTVGVSSQERNRTANDAAPPSPYMIEGLLHWLIQPVMDGCLKRLFKDPNLPFLNVSAHPDLFFYPLFVLLRGLFSGEKPLHLCLHDCPQAPGCWSVPSNGDVNHSFS